VNGDQVMTVLPEYGMPYSCPTKALQKLRDVLETAQIANKASLEWTAEKILPHYSYVGKLESPITEDGYLWFCGCIFALPHGEMVILVPWSRDWGLNESNLHNRTVTVYVRGERIPGEIDSVLQQFAETIKITQGKFLQRT